METKVAAEWENAIPKTKTPTQQPSIEEWEEGGDNVLKEILKTMHNTTNLREEELVASKEWEKAVAEVWVEDETGNKPPVSLNVLSMKQR
jgi:hypothetical protein